MKEEFVTKGIARKLKEKGFKEGCFGYYLPGGDNLIFNYNQWRGGIYEDCLYSHNSLGEDVVGSDLIDVPTVSQVLKWLREEKNIYISIMLFMFQEGWCFEILQFGKIPKLITTQLNISDTYEDAAIAGIEYVIDKLI